MGAKLYFNLVIARLVRVIQRITSVMQNTPNHRNCGELDHPDEPCDDELLLLRLTLFGPGVHRDDIRGWDDVGETNVGGAYPLTPPADSPLTR